MTTWNSCWENGVNEGEDSQSIGIESGTSVFTFFSPLQFKVTWIMKIVLGSQNDSIVGTRALTLAANLGSIHGPLTMLRNDFV